MAEPKKIWGPTCPVANTSSNCHWQQLARIDTTTKLAAYKHSHRTHKVVKTFARYFCSSEGLESPCRSGVRGRVAIGARFDTNKKRVIDYAIIEICCVLVVS